MVLKMRTINFRVELCVLHYFVLCQILSNRVLYKRFRNFLIIRILFSHKRTMSQNSKNTKNWSKSGYKKSLKIKQLFYLLKS